MGGIDYEELERSVNTILARAAYINRLSLAEEEGRSKGGRRNVEASLLAGAGIGAGGRAKSYAATGNGRAGQEAILKSYAKHKGIWITKKEIETWDFINAGMESRVYLKDGKVLKVGYNYLKFYNTPQEFFDNKISLHNYLFPDTFLELIGFTETFGPDGKGVFFAPVVRQAHIQGRVLWQSEIEYFQNELVNAGFTNWVGPATYASYHYLLKDMHLDNVMIDEDDNFLFIDTVPFLNTPALGYGGERKYGSGKMVYL